MEIFLIIVYLSNSVIGRKDGIYKKYQCHIKIKEMQEKLLGNGGLVNGINNGTFIYSIVL